MKHKRKVKQEIIVLSKMGPSSAYYLIGKITIPDAGPMFNAKQTAQFLNGAAKDGYIRFTDMEDFKEKSQ